LFESSAENLVAGQVDVNLATDVFLRDRATGTNLLVSHAAGESSTSGVYESSSSALSADGRYVAFVSSATDLVTTATSRPIEDPEPGEIPFYSNVFLFDRITGSTEMVSRSAVSPDFSANGSSTAPSLSADGRYLAFVSSATDLVANFADANGPSLGDVFLYDRVLRTITLVSWSSTRRSRTGNDGSLNPVMSADGKYVSYESASSDLVPGQSPTTHVSFSENVFLYDRVSSTNRLVSHIFGSQTEGGSDWSLGKASLSADGRFVAFSSLGRDIAETLDPELLENFFLYDRLTGAVTLAGGSGRIEQSPPTLSADGRWLAFVGNDPLTPTYTNLGQVYLFDRISATTTLLTPSALLPDEAGQGGSEKLSISGDGQSIAFASRATDLVPD
ncbi:MAG: TolB family protein, partial [bacterium]